MKIPGCPRYTTRIIMQKKWPIIYFFSDDFELRSPVIQEPFQPKNGIPLS